MEVDGADSAPRQAGSSLVSLSELAKPTRDSRQRNPDLPQLNPARERGLLKVYIEIIPILCAQLNPKLSQLNPNLSQLNPNLSQLNPNLSQLNSKLSQLNPNQSQLNPNLSQLNPNLS